MVSMIAVIFCIGCLFFSLVCPAHRYYRVPLWAYSLIAASIAGLLAGFIPLVGVGVSVILAAGLIAQKAPYKSLRWLGWAGALISAYMLGAHKVPGFEAFTLAADLPLQNGKPSYSILLHLDKAIVGVLLLRLLFSRIQWRLSLRDGGLILIGLAVIYSVAWPLVLQLNIKIGWYLPVFMLTNLLVTCVAEEAFFRGLLQKPLMRHFTGKRSGLVIVLVIGALFAVAHGVIFTAWPVAVAFLTAGVVYAAAYYYSRRVEVSIALHFLTNLIHIVFFNYPL